ARPALDSQGDRLATQGDVPRPVRRLPPRGDADVRRSTAQPGIAAAYGLLRRGRRHALALAIPPDAGRLESAHDGRNGPGRRAGGMPGGARVLVWRLGNVVGVDADARAGCTEPARQISSVRDGQTDSVMLSRRPGGGADDVARIPSMSFALAALWLERQ